MYKQDRESVEAVSVSKVRSVRKHAGGQRVGNHVCSGATWVRLIC